MFLFLLIKCFQEENMMFSRKLISMKTTYKMFFTLKSPSIPLTLSVLTADPDKDILKHFFLYLNIKDDDNTLTDHNDEPSWDGH